MFNKVTREFRRITGKLGDSKKDSGKQKDSDEQKSPVEKKSKLARMRERFYKFNSKSPMENLRKFEEFGINKESSYDCASYKSTVSLVDNKSGEYKEENASVLSDDSSSLKIEIHEKNESLKKDDKIAIERFKPDPLMFRDCRVASVRNFKELAHNLHHALEAGKPAEHVYRVLYFLLREDEAIKKLENAFKKKDSAGRSLETALEQHFGRDESGKPTPQLEYALHLLGEKNTSIDQTFNRRVISKEESLARSECLYNALRKGQVETVYAALTAYQRNTESLCRLNEWYKGYKQELKLDSSADITGLQADMKQYLDGDALKFSLFLIGDETMETKVVSLSEAERLSKMALQQTFERNDGVRVPVPYESSGSGGSECLYRAHILAESLTELGYRVGNLYSVLAY